MIGRAFRPRVPSCLPARVQPRGCCADRARRARKPATPRDHVVETQHVVTIGGREIPTSSPPARSCSGREREEGRQGGRVGRRSPRRRCSSSPIAARTSAIRRSGRSRSRSTAGPARRRCGSISASWGRAASPMGDIGDLPLPPFRLGDNAHSLLDETDLVFIDPVSTGYSRAVPGEKAKEFLTFKKDIESVGDFIRLYTTRYRRWLSPKFLIGESYGTTRAAGLVRLPAGAPRASTSTALMLVSSVLDFQTLDFLPDRTICPTCSTCRPTRDRLVPQAPRARAAEGSRRRRSTRSRRFALGEYAAALLRGAALDDAERARGSPRSSRAHRPVGRTRSSAWICAIEHPIGFTKELLRDQRRTVGPARQPLHRHRPRRRGRRSPRTIRASPTSSGPTPRPSTTTCAASSASRATCPTRSSTCKTNEAWRFA